MDLETLTAFFKWCTIINVGLFLWMALFYLLAPGLVYRTQSKWFPMPRETFNLVFYCFLGGYKLMLIFFCIVPYVALLIIG